MKAVIHHEQPGIAGVKYQEMAEAQTGIGMVKVKLKTAGLNRRDLLVLYRRKKEDPPLVLGSDGAGIVAEIGEGVTHVKVGDEVIINPSLGWRTIGDAPPAGFQILGMPDHGTFAETIVLPGENVEKKPGYLTWEEAGVLALAGLTAYRALFTRGKATPNTTLLIPGIGSGVATFLLQMAKAIGATVIVTSRSRDKRERALQLGADAAIDSNADWDQELRGKKVDLAIECVGASTFNKSLDQLRPGGTLVTFGATTGDEVKFNIRSFFYGQYNLLGTTLGSAEELAAMLRFVEEYRIRPIIDRMYPLAQGVEALQRMDLGEQFGKIGLKIAEEN